MKLKYIRTFIKVLGSSRLRVKDCYFQQKYKFSNLNLIKLKEKNPFIRALN